MATHPLHTLGFEPLLPTLTNLGFEPAMPVGAKEPRSGREVVQPTRNPAVNQALADPDVIAQYARMHLQAVGGTPQDMAKIVKDDTVRWGAVIKSANVTIE